jgi:manganese/zinc/iron transport system permease protein
MIDVLTSYTFLIVAIGTVILASACGIVGTVSVIKGQSLIGDAIGHATFPGIIFAFMLVGMMETYTLALGAVIFGIIAFFTIQILTESSKVTLDSALALILSSFFGLGMALKSYVQGNPGFSGTQGIDDYIFGQAAYMLRTDVYLIIIASVISLLLFMLFYSHIKIYVFDPIFSKSVGVNTGLMNFMILSMTIVLIAVGLKAVGAILIVNLLIAPGVIGLLWSNRFPVVLIIAGISGAISAFFGTYVSTIYTGFATGPSIILAMSALVILSMVFGVKGPLNTRLKRNREVAS